MKKLTDGTGHQPHFSLRTLCRALRFAALNSCGSVPRSLYEVSFNFLYSLFTAETLCKRFVSGRTKYCVLSGSKLFDTLMIFLKEFFPSCKDLKLFCQKQLYFLALKCLFKEMG